MHIPCWHRSVWNWWHLGPVCAGLRLSGVNPFQDRDLESIKAKGGSAPDNQAFNPYGGQTVPEVVRIAPGVKHWH
ncbi:MAG: hypothetical protein GDA36_07475 [Rhodobacteraceae bacterium]|nr:hypothetical protein [Paracoccaceae bacterium]